MPNALALLLAAALVSLPAKTDAKEIKPVKFVCTSEGAVVDVVSRAGDLIMGLSPLPPGCAWLPFGTYGVIGETMFLINVRGGRVARISRVATDRCVGFSAGLIELLS